MTAPDKPKGFALPPPMHGTIERIWEMWEAKPRHERVYLGISQFGDECDRKIWYSFRWASEPEALTGQKLRLFDTGHKEEPRLVEDLRAIGVEVDEVAPGTGAQWEYTKLGGHLIGHLDGIAHNFSEAPAAIHVLELKTHNEKSFKELQSKGVKAAKPGHWLQMQGYMELSGLSRAAYLAKNKNNDDLYFERVEYDPVEAAALMARAERIITADEAPPKLHEDPKAKMAWQCAYCNAEPICHGRKKARVNCRTCAHSTPDTENGGWHCALMDCLISDDTLRVGCASHLYLPSLVPGEQVDADPDAGTITYRMDDGELWTDGAKFK